MASIMRTVGIVLAVIIVDKVIGVTTSVSKMMSANAPK